MVGITLIIKSRRKSRILRSFIFLLLIVIFPSCIETGLKSGEGYVEVEGGRVWYRIVGSGSVTPLLLLHGGPGMPSYYLNSLSQLSDDRPVIFYDQLGAGRSDRPDDPSLWHLDRFVEELAQLRKELGLEEVHILGHSWGTMLAVDYMLTEPKGVKSLILASPALSVQRWSDDAKVLLTTLPESVQKIIDLHESEGTTETLEYQEAVMEYYKLYLCRSDPWPAEMDSVFVNFNPDIYGQMWGPSEFTSTGSLKNYERADVLPKLNLPVLFTTGRYDEATPKSVEYYQSLVANSKLVIFENSAHMTMLDEPEEYANTVRDYLRKIDKNP